MAAPARARAARKPRAVTAAAEPAGSVVRELTEYTNPHQVQIPTVVEAQLAGVPKRAQQVSNVRQALARERDTRSALVASAQAGLTAAAEAMDYNTPGSALTPSANAVTRTWQHAAWGYVATVGELKAAKMFMGNALSRCSLAVGKRNPDGSIEQGFDGDEPAEGLDSDIGNEAAGLISQIQSPTGGQSELLRSYGEKVFVAGECYLVPQNLAQGFRMECLSTQELVRVGERWMRIGGPGYPNEPVEEGTVPVRVWRPDSQWSRLADSSVRSCLEILEELVILTRLVRSSAISRMALSGLLLIPDELDSPDAEAGADGETAEDTNPLATDMITTGAKAIDDPASAASWFPFLLQGPAEDLKEVRHVPFQQDDASNVIKRREALERLAQGLDLPMEVVTGHADTTFSNAKQISQDTFNMHIKPSLDLLCDALTTKYLWPAMAAARGIDAEHLRSAPYPPEILQVAITYDAEKLISRPDNTKDMIALWRNDKTQTVVRIAEMRDALGLDPDLAPDDDEVAKRLDAIRLQNIKETIAAPPSDAAVPISEASAGNAVIPGESAGEGILNGAQETDTAAEEGLTAAGPPELAQFSFMVSGAAALTVKASVRKVGVKLRGKSRGQSFSDVERDAIEGRPNDEVARILGLSVVERILGPDDPTATEVAEFVRQAAEWALELGIPDPARTARACGDLVADTIRTTLFLPPEDRGAITPAVVAGALGLIPA